MAVPLRMNHNKRGGMLARLKILVNSHSQSFHSPAPKRPKQDQSSTENDLDYSICRGRIDVSKWKTLDAKELGITSSMISYPSQFVLKLLRRKGEKAVLWFSRAEVVGRCFPICLVHIKGSVVEVTSFETVARTSNRKEQFLHSLLPKCSNKKDLFRCKNSLRRDFTINSLFYDPFANKIYHYTDGMADLRSLKLETVIPAQMSFKEDPEFCVASKLQLGLVYHLSRETEAAMWKYSSLVKSLDKNKIMIELNYMLSYGASEPSLRLLWKLKLLEFLLPVHHILMNKRSKKMCSGFQYVDGLEAFHLALVNNPQDALVVWAFASVLYHGEWEKGIKFAKEHAKMFIENNSLLQSMSRYPSFPQSAMVFVPKKAGKLAYAIFKMLASDVEFYKTEKRKNSKINYDMLGKGHLSAFVLGKIVLETMSSGTVGDGEDSEAGQCHLKTEGTKETAQSQLPDVVNHEVAAMNGEGQLLSIPARKKQETEIG
ncbi:Poly(A) polymerase I [Glycine max]|nr:Poly(A) polymerase I [Glycine max]